MTNQGLVAKLVCDGWEAADWLQKGDVKAAIATLVPGPATGTLSTLSISSADPISDPCKAESALNVYDTTFIRK